MEVWERVIKSWSARKASSAQSLAHQPMEALSESSLQSLSGAVGMEGTGRDFSTPKFYNFLIAVLATSIRSFTDVRFHGLAIIPRRALQ